MNILLEVCQHPAVLRALYFITQLLNIVFILVPIGLILILTIDFAKSVIYNYDDAKKNTKIIPKRIINAIIIFCIPWFVNVFINTLKDIGFKIEYTSCINNAKSGNFAYYDKLLAEEEAKKEAEKKKYYESLKQNNKNNTKADKSMADKLVSIISKEIGNKNCTNNKCKYGGTSGAAWCAYFANWAMKQTTYNNVNLYKDIVNKNGQIANVACAGATAYEFNKSKDPNLNFYKSKYYGGSYNPKKGDLIYFEWDGNWGGKITLNPGTCSGLGADHIGIISEKKGNDITYISGNCDSTGGTVCKKTFPSNSSYIMGYGSWY